MERSNIQLPGRGEMADLTTTYATWYTCFNYTKNNEVHKLAYANLKKIYNKVILAKH